MTTVEFLDALRRRDIQVRAEGGNLRCRAPRGALTAADRAELADRKDELLLLLADERHAAGRGVAPIESISRRGELPLSFVQERLWFLYQLQPESTAYNIVAAVRFTEALDMKAVERTVTEIARRHETLRTTFVNRDGQPYVEIAAAAPVPVPLVDLRQRSASERSAELDRLTKAEAEQPFDLERGPLVRASVLQSGDRDWQLMIAQHHIVSDRWSLGILMGEVQTLYRDFSSGRDSSLAELPVQYVDFAHWQRERMSGELLDAQLAYWREQLSGELPILDLPTDRPRPPVQTFNGTWESRALPASLGEAIRLLCRDNRVTPFMVFIAAFSVLLQKYTGQDDVIIGSPMAGRITPALEGLIGCFVNSLALRTDLSDDPSFREVLARVRAAALGAYSHAEMPFEKLVAELHPRRDLSRPPLFQVSLAFQSAPRSAQVSSAVTTTTSTGALFDLTLFIVEAEDNFLITAEFNVDLFDRSTIAGLLEHLQQLLESAAAAPDRPASALSMLSERERRQLIHGWNDTAVAAGSHAGIHALIEAQTERTPNAVAATFENSSLTYAELNARANQVAHHLRGLGVGPDTLVGVCMNRSLELIVGLLGVLKAGGAYVPLDPAYPADRLTYLATDARLRIVIAHQATIDQLPDDVAQLVNLGPDWSLAAGEPVVNLSPLTTPDSLAYVMYTSGSTGRPKGVMVTHRGLINYLTWAATHYALEGGIGAPLHSSISFDLTVTSLFHPLLQGKAVIVLSNDDGVEQLGEAIHRQSDFSVLKITPAHLEMLKHEVAPHEAAGRARTFVIGGEALTADMVAFWQEHAPDIQLVNEYGPTETVVGCCTYDIPAGAALTGAVPIGRPIANTQLYVLDDRLQLAPTGVRGELYIGGHGVARGYWDRPALTAERFVPDPYGAQPGARLYRTGDLARYQADGTLAYLGRIDNQVKIRGYRIEPEEIESALVAHPIVKDAIVLAFEAEPGDKRLVAYFVCEDGESLTATELRRLLRVSLPDYMLPSFFVKLDQVPLTSNGKVDRRALPRPFDAAVRPEREYVAPSTPAERQMADVWREALGVETVGVHDNFFDIGGHSLLAMKVIARIDQLWKLKLHPKLMFLESLEQIAARCGRSMTDESAMTAAPGLSGARGTAGR